MVSYINYILSPGMLYLLCTPSLKNSLRSKSHPSIGKADDFPSPCAGGPTQDTRTANFMANVIDLTLDLAKRPTCNGSRSAIAMWDYANK